jgi:hypothetical protein
VEGIIRDTGVIPPEVCVPAKPFRAALKQRGIDTVIAPDEGALPPFRDA